MADTPQAKVDAVVDRGKVSKSEIERKLVLSVPEIQKALPKGRMAEQFVRVALTTVKSSPLILSCTPQSVLVAAFEAAALGLTIDGVLGHAYLVPYKVKGIYRAQLIIGYRGLAELAYRSDMVKALRWDVRHEHDYFDYLDGTDGYIKFRKLEQGDRGEPLSAFAYAKLTRNETVFEVLRKDEIEKRRNSSQSFHWKPEKSPWTTHPEAMWKKSALRALAPEIPQSPDLQRAAAGDDLREQGISPTARIVDSQIVDDVIGELAEGSADA